MKILKRCKDGGPLSPVTAYFLVEWKSVGSIALLHFPKGSRENFHSHAFNSISWVLTGHLEEEFIDGTTKHYLPAFKAVRTFRSTLHRVWGRATTTWVLTFRGPWTAMWQEYNSATDTITVLTYGRKEVVE